MTASGQPLVKIIDLNLIQAFDEWAVQRGMRGRDIADTIAKVMKYWVSFAMSKVPQGNAAKIRSQLQTLIVSYSRAKRGVKSRMADRYRGTLAAAIVMILNYKGARDLARARDPLFYSKVNQFVNSRAYSANHHRSGFLPAINVLGRGKGAAAGATVKDAINTRVPKYKHPPGYVAHKFTDDLASILVENFASAAGPHAAGITGLAGGAFDAGLAEVIKMIGEFLSNDLRAAAQKAGFAVTPSPAAAA